MLRTLPLLLLLALAGCGSGSDSRASGLTRDEEQRLDAAAAATDINASEPAQ